MHGLNTDVRKATNFVVTAVAVVIILVGIVGFFLHYYGKFYEGVVERETVHLKMGSKYIRTIVSQDIRRCLAVIDTGEEAFHHHNFNDNEQIVHILKDIKREGTGLTSVGFVNMQGEAVFDDGTEMLIKDNALLDVVAQDKYYISHFSNNNNPQNGKLLLAVPVHGSKDIIGALFAYYPVAVLSENIGMTGQSIRYFQLLDNNGSYIGRPNNEYAFAGRETLWEELRGYKIADGVTVDQIRRTMKDHERGSFYFEHNNQGRYVVYEPLGINDWYIFSVLVESNLKAYTGDLRRHFTDYLFWLILSIFILCMLFIFNDLEKRRIINAQNRKLLVNNRLFSMILSKTRDIPFEIHLKEKRLIRYLDHISKNVDDYEVIKDFSPDTMLKQDQIHAEDYERYKRIYQDVLSGKVNEPEIFNMKIKGKWTWVKIYMLNVENDILVGFLEDYNEQNLQQEQVVLANQKASQDTLTGLLNREAFVYNVKELIARPATGENVSALFLIDLDYFKEVNDTLGHIIGDQVLLDVANTLKSVLRSSDVVGRLGGDEFVVFIVDAADIQGVHRCAQKLNSALKRTYNRDGKEVAVSASIGVAIAEPGLSFEELYSMADTAVYDVKKLDRDGYQISQEKCPKSIEGKS